MIIIAAIVVLALIIWASFTILLAHRFPSRKRTVILAAMTLPIILCVVCNAIFTQALFSIDLSVPQGVQRETITAEVDTLLTSTHLQNLIARADAAFAVSVDDLREMMNLANVDVNPGVEGDVCILVTPPILLKSRMVVMRRIVVLLEKELATKLKGTVFRWNQSYICHKLTWVRFVTDINLSLLIQIS
jgi:hypothetical protein